MLDTPPAVAEEAVELWIKSYQGEVLGEAYFSRMAELASDPAEKEKLEVLVVLERCTKELLAHPMERLGISTTPDPAIVEGVAALTDYDYQKMIESLPSVTSEYLGCYARLRELVEERDANVVNLLIAHEMALELFARREISGESESSLQPIRALPHVTF